MKTICFLFSPVTHQIRGKKVHTALKVTTQALATTKDKSLTKENQEFLDNVVNDLYANQPEYRSPLADGPWKRNVYTKRTLRTGVLAIKLGNLPQWSKDGKKITTTLLQVIVDNHVIRYYSPEVFKTQAGWLPRWSDKYGSVVVGALSTDPRKYNEQYNEQFLEAGVPPKRKLTRFLVTQDAAIQPGTPLNAMHFRPGDFVDCSAKTIHHGFQGAVKRWGFKGLPKTHGTTKKHRSVGGIGGKTIVSVWKGKKMPGVMGGKWRTLKGLKILRINTKYNVLYVKGQNIPGETHTFVRINDTVLPLRRKTENPPPMPTWYPEDESEQLAEEYFDEDLFQFTNESLDLKTGTK
ncbi:hypothetical protein LOTGIDRAFT_108795 [Lottia gigantea]|uniref:Large ribosomal subunit protein uL3m n=1 Tax=Lottia gigantea TaxID=225164 RepID=V3ZF77_LOTGI|nr:hypothetical protein LOTGIDRAFT_108795 [Lottia gigantea]ESO82772.1 hypothetical protein LOTGIDRAFT_108795 [Lottia gigantea]